MTGNNSSASSDRLIRLTATALGSGNLPAAPGTWGSAAAVLLFLPLLGLPEAMFIRLGAALLAIFSFLICGWISPSCERIYGTRDPKQFVADELSGQFLVLVCLPVYNAAWIAAGFAVFRFFDILKPFPIRRLEKLNTRWDIVLDDIAAGVYGALVLTVLHPL